MWDQLEVSKALVGLTIQKCSFSAGGFPGISLQSAREYDQSNYRSMSQNEQSFKSLRIKNTIDSLSMHASSILGLSLGSPMKSVTFYLPSFEGPR